MLVVDGTCGTWFVGLLLLLLLFAPRLFELLLEEANGLRVQVGLHERDQAFVAAQLKQAVDLALDQLLSQALRIVVLERGVDVVQAQLKLAHLEEDRRTIRIGERNFASLLLLVTGLLSWRLLRLLFRHTSQPHAIVVSDQGLVEALAFEHLVALHAHLVRTRVVFGVVVASVRFRLAAGGQKGVQFGVHETDVPHELEAIEIVRHLQKVAAQLFVVVAKLLANARKELIQLARFTDAFNFSVHFNSSNIFLMFFLVLGFLTKINFPMIEKVVFVG